MIGPASGKKILPSRGLPTPFGEINLPQIDTPVLALPEVGDRRKKAIKHMIGIDLSGVLALIPWAGSVVSGQISDLHYAEVRKILTPQELSRYIEADKRIPANTPAMLYSFVKGSLPGVK